MLHLPYFSDNLSLGNSAFCITTIFLPVCTVVGLVPPFVVHTCSPPHEARIHSLLMLQEPLSFPGIFAMMKFIRPLSASALLSSSLELSGFNPLCFLASWAALFFILPKFSSFSRPLKDHCPSFWNALLPLAISYLSLKPRKESFSLPLLLMLELASLVWAPWCHLHIFQKQLPSSCSFLCICHCLPTRIWHPHGKTCILLTIQSWTHSPVSGLS